MCFGPVIGPEIDNKHFALVLGPKTTRRRSLMGSESGVCFVLCAEVLEDLGTLLRRSIRKSIFERDQGQNQIC